MYRSKKRQEQKEWSFSCEILEVPGEFSYQQRAAKIKVKKAEKKEKLEEEEELTPPSSFWHHKHTESMTCDFLHSVMGVGGFT